MMTDYLTTEMCAEVRAELLAWTPEQHLAEARRLLAGDFTRTGLRKFADFKWVPPTAEEAARAQAHAALAAAILAFERSRQGTVGAVEIRPAVPR